MRKSIEKIADAYFCTFAALLFVLHESLAGRADERAAIAVGVLGIAAGIASLGDVWRRALEIVARRLWRVRSLEIYPRSGDVELTVGTLAAVNVGELSFGDLLCESVQAREVSPGSWRVDVRFASREPLRILDAPAGSIDIAAGPDPDEDPLADAYRAFPLIEPASRPLPE